MKTCEDCEYYWCGVNNCFCKNFTNDLKVPRIIQNAPDKPSWCPKEREEDISNN